MDNLSQFILKSFIGILFAFKINLKSQNTFAFYFLGLDPKVKDIKSHSNRTVKSTRYINKF